LLHRRAQLPRRLVYRSATHVSIPSTTSESITSKCSWMWRWGLHPVARHRAAPPRCSSRPPHSLSCSCMPCLRALSPPLPCSLALALSCLFVSCAAHAALLTVLTHALCSPLSATRDDFSVGLPCGLLPCCGRLASPPRLQWIVLHFACVTPAQHFACVLAVHQVVISLAISIASPLGCPLPSTAGWRAGRGQSGTD
jgi:hypothetical protein